VGHPVPKTLIKFILVLLITLLTRLQKGQQYFQVEEITPKNRVFNALSLKLSHYDDKVGYFSFASRKNSVFAVESLLIKFYSFPNHVTASRFCEAVSPYGMGDCFGDKTASQ